MSGVCLQFEDPITDAISKIRFAPQWNNLLISSWDSNLRLYDVDKSLLRLKVSSEAALLDCCFQDDAVAYSSGSDGAIRRYDLHSGNCDAIGNHDDVATCVQYSDETCHVISAGLDKKMVAWDVRMGATPAFCRNLGAEVVSMSVSGFDLIVAAGASVNMYDLRNLDRFLQSSKSPMDVHIKCVSAVPNSKGYVVGSIDGRVTVDMSHASTSDNMRYTFRCHPKSKDGRYHLVSVNEIVFRPLTSGTFVTGDNKGNVIAWDAESRRRVYELPRFPNSVASLSYNHEGELLAVASSYTYQEARELEEPPQIYIHKMDGAHLGSVSAERRKYETNLKGGLV